MSPARPRRTPPGTLFAILALALAAAPAAGQQGPRAPGKAGPDRPGQEKAVQEKAAQEKAATDRPGAAPVIGCPSLANYRLLMRAGAGAAAALLADPKADHLGCIALPRGRLAGIADRVSLGARSYACATVQGTTACHWMEAGPMPAAQTAR